MQMACSGGISGDEDCENKGSLGKREACVPERNGWPKAAGD